MSLTSSAAFGSNYLSVANYTGNPAAFSVSCWAYLRGSQVSRIFFSNYQPTGSKGWAVGISDSTSNQLKFYLGSNTLFQSGTLLTGTWYHCVFTWDGTTATIYINGSSNNTLTSGVSYGTAPTNNYIGTLDGTNQDFHGLLAGVGYWSKSLSSGEVATLYNSGQGLSASDLSGSLLTSLGSYHDFSNASSLGTDGSGNGHTYTNNGSVVQSPISPAVSQPSYAWGARAYGNRVLSRWPSPRWARDLRVLHVADSQGGSLIDRTRQGHDGSLTGGCSWTRGPWGQQLSLDGASGTMVHVNNLSLATLSQFTVCVLARSNTAAGSGDNIRYLSAQEAAIGFNFALRFFTSDFSSPDLIGFKVGTGTEATATRPTGLFDWVLYTGRYKAGVCDLFYGGTNVATTSDAPSTVPSFTGDVANFYVGGNAQFPTRAWSGDIALHAVWQRALTDSEIASLADRPWSVAAAPRMSPAILAGAALQSLTPYGRWSALRPAQLPTADLYGWLD